MWKDPSVNDLPKSLVVAHCCTSVMGCNSAHCCVVAGWYDWGQMFCQHMRFHNYVCLLFQIPLSIVNQKLLLLGSLVFLGLN